MKCYKCGGTGVYDIYNECPVCDGTGEYDPTDKGIGLLKEVIETNEEYLRSCNTEQLAEWLFQIFGEGVAFGETHGKTKLFPNDDIIHEGLVMEWLKQPHS